MTILTAAQMRETDRRAIDGLGVPGVCLMQSAGEALARACGTARRIVVLCGSGNNGGDGFVAARHLVLQGAAATVCVTTPPRDPQSDAGRHFAALAHSGATITETLPELSRYDLIVDCLLGTGATGAPRGKVAEWIAAANAAGVPILACDLPSGVDADTGAVTDAGAIRAERTLTLVAYKPGLLLYPGAEYAGHVTVAAIGMPRAALAPSQWQCTTAAWVRTVLPPRRQSRDANKGSFGKVLVVAGARGMAGAAILTATAALRAGAGLVYLALPESLAPIAATLAPEVVLCPLPETPEGTHGHPDALARLEPLLSRVDAIAIGPGLTTHPTLDHWVPALLTRATQPVVVDADGLNALIGQEAVVRAREARGTVLTPHPGELGRLLQQPATAIQVDRPAAALAVARNFGATTLLKGVRTLVSTPEGMLSFNRAGSVALATAGSGDVLTGVIAALLAQGRSAEDAARAGAYLHALAGELAEETWGAVGVLASELRDLLPAARRQLDSDKELDG